MKQLPFFITQIYTGMLKKLIVQSWLELKTNKNKTNATHKNEIREWEAYRCVLKISSPVMLMPVEGER